RVVGQGLVFAGVAGRIGRMNASSDKRPVKAVQRQSLDYEFLQRLRHTDPTLKLLAADNGPLIISFLYLQFVRASRRTINQSDLVSRLEDYLYHLRRVHGEGLYPKSAQRYLDDWSDEPTPFLRKYYLQQGDEPVYDLTPATEKAVEWLQELQVREFVGTESRLLTVFRLLQEIVSGSEQDPGVRIAELERRKEVIDREIEEIRAGRIATLDSTQVRERFHQAEDTARKLLADFRQVEYNFRELDRRTRERIAISERPKGEMLDEIFSGHDEIRDSDQGRSFRAFWEFLMSPQRQEELETLVSTVAGLVRDDQGLDEGMDDSILSRIRYYLLDAGEKVYQTNNQLLEQLRKYLDDQAWLENKRIMALIRSIEKRAISLKGGVPRMRDFSTLDALHPAIELIMSRGLYQPPKESVIEMVDLRDGEADVKVDALFEQTYVDRRVLADRIERLLQRQSQVSLSQLLARYPVEKGVAEVLGYLSLAVDDSKAMIDSANEERLNITDEQGRQKQVRLPTVVYTR
ncbi:MAG: DUF3375 domain-containing protein, partial [Candidatus Sedimenticola endophacoides]